MIKNDLLIKAAKMQKTERTPIWIMRQAGRYLPEYRKIREKADFLTMIKTPELATEVTIQPVDIIGVDAAIIFSDILVIPEAMGFEYSMQEKVGPKFKTPIVSANQIRKIEIPDVREKLNYVFEAVKMTKSQLNGKVPLIGFSGSPWTLLTYLIEGGSSKNFGKTKKFILNERKAAHQLLEKISLTIIEYLSIKIESGIDIYQIFDSWGGVLSKSHYLEFSLKYIDLIISELKKRYNIPSIIFSKGVFNSLEEMSETQANVISLDWTIPIDFAKKVTNNKKSLQGNLDPTILYANETEIAKEAEKVLAEFGNGNGHIFNLGHGILPDIEPSKLKFLVDYVKSESRKYHE